MSTVTVDDVQEALTNVIDPELGLIYVNAGNPSPDYDGSARSLGQVKANIERSGEIGQLVASSFASSVIVVPLLTIDTQTPTLGRSPSRGQESTAIHKGNVFVSVSTSGSGMWPMA